MNQKVVRILAAASVSAMTLSGLALPVYAGETYHVGICQLVQHPALDAATRKSSRRSLKPTGTLLSSMSRMQQEIPQPVRRL